MSQALIITTDIVMLGWLGIEMLAAAGYGVRLYMPLFLFVLGTALCIMVLAGRAMGAKDYDSLRLVVRKLLYLGLCLGVVSSFILIFSIRPIMSALGSADTLINMTEGYVFLFAFSLPFVIFCAGLRSFMTVVGKPSPFMYVSFILVAVNAFFDYGLAFGHFGLPEMGLNGIAISSTFVGFINAIILFWICKYMAPFKKYKIFINTGQAQTYKTVALLKIALPMSAKLVLETLFYSIGFFIVGTFGAIYLAGYQIVYQIDTNIFLFGIGASSAISTRVAYNIGAKNSKGVKLAALSGMFILAIWSGLAGILSFVYAQEIAEFFIRNTGPASIETHIVIVKMLFVLMLYQIFHGMNLGLASAIDGMGHTGSTMKLFIISIIFVGVPLSYILSYYTDLGALGVLYATGASMTLNVILMIGVWVKYIKELAD